MAFLELTSMITSAGRCSRRSLRRRARSKDRDQRSGPDSTRSMEGQLTFLGTGTSMGVPTLGCECAVCTSADPHDRRLRPSVLLRWNEAEQGGRERVVVIDTGPDFREQALARAAHARGRGVLYARARRPHSGHGRSAAAELYRGSRGRADSALRRRGDGGGAGAGLRLHIFAACDLSNARARGAGAAGRTQSRCTVSSLCAFRCCMARWRLSGFALATQPI